MQQQAVSGTRGAVFSTERILAEARRCADRAGLSLAALLGDRLARAIYRPFVTWRILDEICGRLRCSPYDFYDDFDRRASG